MPILVNRGWVPRSWRHNSLKGMRIGEKGKNVSDKRAALGVENVDRIKKTDVERVKLPKSISVRCNVYGSTVRARVEDRVKKVTSDMQKVYVRGKKEEQPLELQVSLLCESQQQQLTIGTSLACLVLSWLLELLLLSSSAQTQSRVPWQFVIRSLPPVQYISWRFCYSFWVG
ncbi:uncharacterized protein [Rutidosis leptorrhynchoides]|uniref:uncharacterized protein isoform X2 n=1 Tax=Rutidosis leptorrhynchoides TaxID=125765 RepID=UPI003A993A5C